VSRFRKRQSFPALCALLELFLQKGIYSRTHTVMTEEERTKRQRMQNVVTTVVQSAATSAGVAVPPSRLVEKMPADLMAKMLSMLSLKEGVQLRTVSKPHGNRFVLPEGKFPRLDAASLSGKQITAALASDAAMKTLQRTLWLTRSLDLSHVLQHSMSALLSRIKFMRLQALDMHVTGRFFQDETDLRALASLVELTSLTATGVTFADLTPLALLVHLRTLDLSWLSEGDLTPLAALVRLQTLHLNAYGTGQLRPLAALVQLKTLTLGRHYKGDLTALASLAQLQTLKLGVVRDQDLTALSKLTQLQTLTIEPFQTGDLSPLAALERLETLRLPFYEQGELAPLSHLTHLKYLQLTNYKQGDVTPLTKLVQLKELDLRQYPSLDKDAWTAFRNALPKTIVVAPGERSLLWPVWW